MNTAELLLLLALLTPLALLAGCFLPSIRRHVPLLLGLAPLPALLTAVWAMNQPPWVFNEAHLQLTIRLDTPGAILLGVAALLWSAAGFYTATYLRKQPGVGRFSVYWLLTMTGSLGVFIAADLFTFYLTFALLSLAAYGLVVFDGTPKARRAGTIYLVLALLGEIFLLMGFVLFASAVDGDSLAIADAVAALPHSPWRDPAIALVVSGFGLKMGLVPLHVWLPIAHPAAPMPASAVLSGAIIKAGVIGLIRFLPFDLALADWGAALMLIGLATAFYSVAVGITQSNPKTLLAYSSVSQMGVVATVLGAGLAVGSNQTTLLSAFYAAHHLLAKGALFMAVGVIAATGMKRRLWVLIPVTILAVGLGGFPLTGGALAKAAVKPLFVIEHVKLLADFSALGTTLLMLHFVRCLSMKHASEPDAVAPLGMSVPWLVMFAAALLIPWLLYPVVTGGTYSELWQAKALWAGTWAVLGGALLAVGLWRWSRYLPALPEGDIVVVAQPVLRVLMRYTDALVQIEHQLRKWSVASLSLLLLLLLFGAVMFQGH